MPICFLAVGAAVLLGTAFSTFETLKFTRRAHRTQATAVAATPTESAAGNRAILAFTDTTGKTQRILAQQLPGSAPAVGETMDVLYLAGQPEGARLESFRALWLNHSIGGIVGLALFAIGVFTSIAVSRRHSDHKTRVMVG